MQKRRTVPASNQQPFSYNPRCACEFRTQPENHLSLKSRSVSTRVFMSHNAKGSNMSHITISGKPSASNRLLLLIPAAHPAHLFSHTGGLTNFIHFTDRHRLQHFFTVTIVLQCYSITHVCLFCLYITSRQL